MKEMAFIVADPDTPSLHGACAVARGESTVSLMLLAPSSRRLGRQRTAKRMDPFKRLARPNSFGVQLTAPEMLKSAGRPWRIATAVTVVG